MSPHEATPFKIIYLLLGFTLSTNYVTGSAEEYDLVTSLLQNYSSYVRPVNNASESLVVSVGLALNQIIDMDERNQILTLKVWMRLKWRDDLLRWDHRNDDKYKDISAIRISPKEMWIPDITLYTDVGDGSSNGLGYPAVIYKDGTVTWNYPLVLLTTCSINVQYVPWDQQACPLKFGSWSYDGASIDVVNTTSTGDDYYFIKNGEWQLIGIPVTRHNILYNCCKNPYPDVTFWVVMRRKPLYYVFNLLLPCLFIVATTILVFYLPPESGEKISLAMTGLLALTVFLLLVAETLPPQSDSIPLIGSYFAATIVLLSLSTALTVVVLNLYHRGILGNDIPSWAHTLVLSYLARILFMRQSVERNVSKKHIKNFVPAQARKVSDEIPVGDVESEDSSVKKFIMVGETDSKFNNLLLEIRNTVQEMRKSQQKQEDDFGCRSNWILVAVILDRFFLIMFLCLTLVVSLCILLSYPDYTEFDINSIIE